METPLRADTTVAVLLRALRRRRACPRTRGSCPAWRRFPILSAASSERLSLAGEMQPRPGFSHEALLSVALRDAVQAARVLQPKACRRLGEGDARGGRSESAGRATGAQRAVLVLRLDADAVLLERLRAGLVRALPAAVPRASCFCACVKSRCNALASLPVSRRALLTNVRSAVQVAGALTDVVAGALSQFRRRLLSRVERLGRQLLERGRFRKRHRGAEQGLRNGLLGWRHQLLLLC
jgi:hypothetical protein